MSAVTIAGPGRLGPPNGATSPFFSAQRYSDCHVAVGRQPLDKLRAGRCFAVVVGGFAFFPAAAGVLPVLFAVWLGWRVAEPSLSS